MLLLAWRLSPKSGDKIWLLFLSQSTTGACLHGLQTYPRPHRASCPRSRGVAVAQGSLPSHRHTCAALHGVRATWQESKKQTPTYFLFLKTFWRPPSPSPTVPGLRWPSPRHPILLPTRSGSCPPSPGNATPWVPTHGPCPRRPLSSHCASLPSLKPQRKRRLWSPAVRGCCFYRRQNPPPSVLPLRFISLAAPTPGNCPPHASAFTLLARLP